MFAIFLGMPTGESSHMFAFILGKYISCFASKIFAFLRQKLLDKKHTAVLIYLDYFLKRSSNLINKIKPKIFSSMELFINVGHMYMYNSGMSSMISKKTTILVTYLT